MKNSVICLLLLCAPAAFAVQDVASAVEGTIKSIDRAGKVVVVDTDEGTKHTFHYAGDLAVHVMGKGGRVAAHYTVNGGRETVHEIDNLGDGGLKVVHGTVTHIDHRTRRLSIATADGTVETVHMTAAAADDTARATGKGTAKGLKVSVYYTEKAGKKTAHFVEKLV